MRKRTLRLKRIVMVLTAFGVCAAAWAADFELKPGKELQVLHGGKALLAGDEIHHYGPGWKAGTLNVRTGRGMTVANTSYGSSRVFQYRREVGVSKNRIELTCQFRLFPYNNDPGHPSLSYVLRVPWARLKNTSWRALTDRASRVKVKEGKLGATRADGTIARGVRYIAFKGPETRLVFDLNPKGLFTMVDYGTSGFIGSWSVVKRGDFVEFGFGYGARFHGGTVKSKALIYEGEYAFERDHAFRKCPYFTSFPFAGRFYFGAAAAPEGWESIGGAASDAGSWDDFGRIKATSKPGKGLFDNAFVGRGKNGLSLRVTPGVYFVTLRAAGADAGPFDVRLGGEVKAREVRVKRAELTELYLTTYCREPTLRIEFATKGTWAVSTVVVQPMIYRYEDFAFDRGPWLVDGIFTPEG